MNDNKGTFHGKVTEIGEWIETRKGDHFRELIVEVEMKRMQYYLMTQFVSKDQTVVSISLGEKYIFNGFWNGIILNGKSINTFCILTIHGQL